METIRQAYLGLIGEMNTRGVSRSMMQAFVSANGVRMVNGHHYRHAEDPDMQFTLQVVKAWGMDHAISFYNNGRITFARMDVFLHGNYEKIDTVWGMSSDYSNYFPKLMEYCRLSDEMLSQNGGRPEIKFRFTGQESQLDNWGLTRAAIPGNGLENPQV